MDGSAGGLLDSLYARRANRLSRVREFQEEPDVDAALLETALAQGIAADPDARELGEEPATSDEDLTRGG